MSRTIMYDGQRLQWLEETLEKYPTIDITATGTGFYEINLYLDDTFNNAVSAIEVTLGAAIDSLREKLEEMK